MAMTQSKVVTDSGHAWVILVGCFFATGFTAFVYANGIFNVEFLAEFGKSHALTSGCLALQIGLSNITGLLGSLVIHRYGAWLSMFIAGLLIVVGFLATAFATSFWQVFIAYGLASGTGFGFGYTTAVITVGLHFERYRNIACAITTGGVSIGTMAFAPMLERLIDAYSWRGALIVSSALFANYFGISLLLKPSSKHKQTFNEYSIDQKDKGVETEFNSFHDINSGKSKLTGECKQASTTVHSNVCAFSDIKMAQAVCQINGDAKDISTISLKSCDKSDNSKCVQQSADFKTALENYNTKTKSKYRDQITRGTYWYLESRYIALITHVFAGCFGLSCIYVHFPAYVIHLGTSSERASLMVSAMGLGDILGRLLFGAITSIWKQTLPAVYVLTSALAGIIGLLGPFMCQHVIGQLLFGMLFMSLGNILFALMAPMCVHAVGVKNLNLALGIASFSCGTGLLIGPPVTGWLFDITGSYIYTFILTGMCYLFGSTPPRTCFKPALVTACNTSNIHNIPS